MLSLDERGVTIATHGGNLLGHFAAFQMSRCGARESCAGMHVHARALLIPTRVQTARQIPGIMRADEKDQGYM